MKKKSSTKQIISIPPRYGTNFVLRFSILFEKVISIPPRYGTNTVKVAKLSEGEGYFNSSKVRYKR